MADFKAFVSGESEQAFRKFWARLFKQSGTAGIAQAGVLGSGTDLLVSQTSTASASVQVASGLAVVQDTVGNGVSPLLRDATGNLDVLTANPMGATPRNDLVVFDSATSSVRVIVGTPNAVPTDPAVPSTAVALARLRHQASATTVPASRIDDLRSFTSMLGGPYPQVSDISAGKRIHRVKTTVTPNATGYATVTHQAGFTPFVVVGTCEQAYMVGVDPAMITSTTFVVRVLTPTGVSPATPVTLMFICWE